MNRVLFSFYLALIVSFSNSPVFAESSNSKAPPPNQVASSIERININSANAENIASVMTGIGLKRAKAIVAWREANGPFKSIDQLVEVKGIGSATLAKNRDRLSLK